MNFDDTPEEAAFRAEVQAWLAQNAGLKQQSAECDIALSDLQERSPEEERSWVRACLAWQQRKYEAGYGAISWSREAGGRGGTTMQEIIFGQEESRFDVATGALTITLGMVAPTIFAHGTQEQRAAYIPNIISGKEVWCQLFSEPGAGSDLASLQTRAVRDGDEWVISGQKVWTSGAQYADWGYILTRTDATVPKHDGITAFLLPMNAPGVSVRPLRQMSGGASFNEVFFDDIRLADSHRLGGVGRGWSVALTTLMNERFSAGALGSGAAPFQALRDLAKEHRTAGDGALRDRLAQTYILVQVDTYLTYRTLTAISKGQPPGPEGSLRKLSSTRGLRAIGELSLSLLGPDGLLANRWTQLVLRTPGLRIAGGTDEVLRNVIAERVLGLPKEP